MFKYGELENLYKGYDFGIRFEITKIKRVKVEFELEVSWALIEPNLAPHLSRVPRHPGKVPYPHALYIYTRFISFEINTDHTFKWQENLFIPPTWRTLVSKRDWGQ